MNNLLTRISNSFGINYNSFLDKSFKEANQDLVRFYKVEYGKEWKAALDLHLYNKNKKNVKKAA